ncbi:sulfurtransferase [Aeromicrobium sp. UC242_57]|uniref:sulfurtransferase n=1 Tax=Aeromicrobium sp. UC242_57 TaxID=3374624 RepID=UPI0037913A06
MPILITADELAELAGVSSPRVLDVRWRLDRPDGRGEHRAGHVPGAVYVDLDHELAAHGVPTDGRHPLPAVEALQVSARSWGIDDDSTVVVYDDQGNLAAGRAWWLLTYAGVQDVRVLDGGLQAWTAAGRELATGGETAPAGSVTLAYGHLPVIGADEALDAAAEGSLLDARAPERYRGETEPIDPVAGHIPGALNTRREAISTPTAGSCRPSSCGSGSSRPVSTRPSPSRRTAAPASLRPTTSSR